MILKTWGKLAAHVLVKARYTYKGEGRLRRELDKWKNNTKEHKVYHWERKAHDFVPLLPESLLGFAV